MPGAINLRRKQWDRLLEQKATTHVGDQGSVPPLWRGIEVGPAASRGEVGEVPEMRRAFTVPSEGITVPPRSGVTSPPPLSAQGVQRTASPPPPPCSLWPGRPRQGTVWRPAPAGRRRPDSTCNGWDRAGGSFVYLAVGMTLAVYCWNVNRKAEAAARTRTAAAAPRRRKRPSRRSTPTQEEQAAVELSINRGVRYLKTSQHPNGTWEAAHTRSATRLSQG